MSNKATNVVSCLMKSPAGLILVQDHVKIGGITIPSGAVEDDESIIEAMRRELREELNVDLDSLKIHRVTEHEHDEIHTIEHRFHVEVGDVFFYENMEPEKHNWVKFLTMDELDNYDGNKSVILESALA